MASDLSIHTGTPAHAVAFPPFQTDTFASQLIWLVVSFILLYALVAKFGLPRIGAILEERRKHIADDLVEASRQKTESQRVMDAYHDGLSDARNRASILIGKTEQRLKFEAVRERELFQKDIKRNFLAAECAIGKAKEAATANIRMIAAETASDVVTRLVGKTPGRDVVFEAVGRVLKQ